MSVVIESLVAACTSKVCAPPPVGTGGSVHRAPASPWPGVSADVYDAWSASRRKMRDARSSSNVDTRLAAGTVISYIATGYHDINDSLRRFTLDELAPSTAGEVASMHLGFRKFGVSLPEDVTVYRGMKFEDVGIDDIMSMFAPGSKFKDRAFVSTSLSRQRANTFAEAGSLASKDPEKRKSVEGIGVRLRIRVRKGVKVLAGSRPEQELILNAGTEFTIKSVRQSTPQFLTVDIEVVK